MKPSIIRALLKLVQNNDVISFAGGTPDAKFFPLELIAELTQKVILEQGRLTLQYGETIGWTPLREQVCQYLKTSKGLDLKPENILITTGSQQGIDLLSRVFIDAGDRVAVEDPAYLGALIVFGNYGASLAPLEMDSQGLKPEAFEALIKTGKPKMIYLTPTFQNPSGRLLSEARRKQIAELCGRHNVILVEDDPYGEIDFNNIRPKTVCSFEPSGNGFYLGSFSKMSVPGIRLGFVAGPADAIAKLTMAKETLDICSSVLSQAIAAEFLKGGHLGPHIQILNKHYHNRAKVMTEALRTEAGDAFEFEEPQGGFFIWGKVRGCTDAEALFKRAVDLGVAYVPGTAFFVEPSRGINTLRMTFVAADEDRIREGVKRLAPVLRHADQVAAVTK